MSPFARPLTRILARTSLLACLQMLWVGHAAWAQVQPSLQPSPQAAPHAEVEEDGDGDGATVADSRLAKGDATRAWLTSQAGRKQASSTRQTLSGPVMSRVHDRYVKSFGQEIERTSIRADMPNTNR